MSKRFRHVLIGFVAVFLLSALIYEARDRSTFIEKIAEAARSSVVANQRSPRQIAWRMLDDDGTNNASISIGSHEVSISDTATGQYLITFSAEPFFRAPVILCQDASTDTIRHQCDIGTTNPNNFAIRCFSVADPTTASNFDIFNCIANGWDAAEY
jgi:hypothetical protein